MRYYVASLLARLRVCRESSLVYLETILGLQVLLIVREAMLLVCSMSLLYLVRCLRPPVILVAACGCGRPGSHNARYPFSDLEGIR
jgi:hypothetical protein